MKFFLFICCSFMTVFSVKAGLNSDIDGYVESWYSGHVTGDITLKDINETYTIHPDLGNETYTLVCTSGVLHLNQPTINRISDAEIDIAPATNITIVTAVLAIADPLTFSYTCYLESSSEDWPQIAPLNGVFLAPKTPINLQFTYGRYWYYLCKVKTLSLALANLIEVNFRSVLLGHSDFETWKQINGALELNIQSSLNTAWAAIVGDGPSVSRDHC